MSDNKAQIKKFIKKHQGQLCLDACGELVRLIEFYEDDEDYYYYCRTLNRRSSDGYIRHSAVGWMIPLKDKLTDKEYEYLDTIFTLNWLHSSSIKNDKT